MSGEQVTLRNTKLHACRIHTSYAHPAVYNCSTSTCDKTMPKLLLIGNNIYESRWSTLVDDSHRAGRVPVLD